MTLTPRHAPRSLHAQSKPGPKHATPHHTFYIPGEGEFVCKTCSRAFTSFQALGGHRTSHLRGRHGLELGVGVGVAKAIRESKRREDREHECHVCGLGFETGQALGGHMRRHRQEMALSGGDDSADRIAVPDQEAVGRAVDRPPVLLDLTIS